MAKKTTVYWVEETKDLRTHIHIKNKAHGARGAKLVSSFPSRTIVCAGVSSDQK